MRTIETVTWTMEDVQEELNRAKDLLADRLQLPQLDDYLIVVARRSALGRFADWWKDTDSPGQYSARIVRRLPDQEERS